MFFEHTVGHALAFALKRGAIPRDAINLSYLTPKEQADFHVKCDELGIPTSESIIADLANRSIEAARAAIAKAEGRSS